ncbi:hypothetical protein MOMOMMO210B_19545 [Morganella morganii]
MFQGVHPFFVMNQNDVKNALSRLRNRFKLSEGIWVLRGVFDA